jgi:hypothetical protein
VRQRRWSELLSEYGFEITYIKGMINRVADALIRRPCICSIIPLKLNLREKVLALHFDDDCYKEVKANTGQDTVMVPKFEGYSLDNDEFLRYNDIIYVPPNNELRILILNKAHRAA